NNLANASTPGYHRRVANYASRAPLRSDRFSVGSGVDIGSVQRLQSAAIEKSLLRNSSEAGFSQQSLDIANQIESLLTPSDTSIHSSLSDFFNGLEKVANSPQDLTVRRDFLSSATELMNGFRTLDQQLSSLSREVSLSLNDSVKQVNQYVKNIAKLNTDIFQARTMGISDSSLLDQRDLITSQLSNYIEVENTTTSDGHEITRIAGGTVTVGSQPVTFSVRKDAQGAIGISVGDVQTTIALNSGSFAATTTALNDTIPQFQSRLRDLARGIVQTVDQQHAQGISDQGPATVLRGGRSVTSVTLPLARSNPEFPINSGNLSVSVTNISTGVRQTQIISINPAVDSLNDVAAKLSTIPGVVASVNSTTNTLVIAGNGTNAIDFSGRSDDPLDLSINPRPDESGILAALGIGSLFQGSEPGNFKVRDAILQNPEQFVVSTTGLPGDGRNAAAMASLRDVRFDPLGGRTFTEELADVTAESGLQVQTSDTQNTQLQTFRQRLEMDQASISGVDINEEMLKMMQTQRGYQAAAKLITTADQMLTELFNLIR
ncbi:MAG: flagellar hook-associated protein FlgK, partial [Planctomycetota bacterium]|nr:flagellar hook-associated protein FlgK [Planctomycetota bacterium]